MKTKLPHAAPASELFTSPLFRGRCRWVQTTCQRWFVLSAKYGLLSPDAVVDPYDITLNGARKAQHRAWTDRVLDQLTSQFQDLSAQEFEVHAGNAYREYLVADLRQHGVSVEVALEGLSIGKQLAAYAGSASPAAVAAGGGSTFGRPGASAYHPLSERLGPLTETELSLSFSDVEAIIGRLLPASARRHRPWWANSASSPQARAWLDAGWSVAAVDLEGQRVRLRRQP